MKCDCLYNCHFCFHEILYLMRVNFHNITEDAVFIMRGRCVYGARTLCLHCEDAVFTVRGRCVYTARTLCLSCEDAVSTLRGRCVYHARTLCLKCKPKHAVLTIMLAFILRLAVSTPCFLWGASMSQLQTYCHI